MNKDKDIALFSMKLWSTSCLVV